MALNIITLKIMPSSPKVDLRKLQINIEKKIKEVGGILHKVSEEPIAFGLKALIFVIGWREEANLDIVETELSRIKDISSIEIIDVRRAIG
ncbi:MAG: elongation factor 1-beta [Candidatus Pacearchaeota archaeon]